MSRASSDSEISAYRQWYERAYGTIERGYVSLGHSLGFNPPLLNGVASLAAQPRMFVATLNPAGSVDYLDHRGLYRYEGQNAYLDVDWIGQGVGRAPLQRQMQAIFEHLRLRVSGSSVGATTFARSHVATAQLIPFRSPSEDTLHRHDESVRLAQGIWQELFKLWLPSMAVTVGNTTTEELSVLLGSVQRDDSLPIGWGKYRLKMREFSCGTRLIGLPHLSRFAVFGRPQSAPYLNEAFDWLFQRVGEKNGSKTNPLPTR